VSFACFILQQSQICSASIAHVEKMVYADN
jgi:hypothetical protein